MRGVRHSHMGKVLAISLILLAVGVVTPTPGSAGAVRPAGQPFKIGVIAPTTGGTALIGQQSVDGARMAAEEINAEGGLAGRPIEIIAEDEAGQPAVGVAAMNKLVYSDKVNFLLGPDTSSVTLAARLPGSR